jgi:hypothetical protein
MKNAIQMVLVGVAMIAFIGNTNAQKKVKTFSVEKVIDLPVDKIWEVVGEDYGAVAHSHPKIIKSDYINGSLKGGEGAERVCYFNEKGSQYLEEKIVSYDPTNYSYTNTISRAGKFPVDEDLTKGEWKMEDMGDGTTMVKFNMEFRTKPAFMGGMMKRQFKGLIEDYFISIEHYVRTGEAVTKDNFKEVKKQYRSRT